MKRLLLPSEQPRIPSEGTFFALDFGGLLLMAGYLASVVPLVCINMGGYAEPVGWAIAHHLHWIYGAGAVAALLWFWKALRWRGKPPAHIIGHWAIFSLMTTLPFASTLMVINTLNFAPAKPVAGRVMNVINGKHSRRVRLQKTDGTRVTVPLSSADWSKAVEGATYQRGMREGLLGILWCWSWE